MMNLDKSSAKNILHEVGTGYNLRPIPKPVSIIIHTTNGRKGSSFSGEVKYLRDSPLVSAHYLVGKQGQIVQFLDPLIYTAWHTGAVRKYVYNNQYSVGIENHYTPGEGSWTDDMKDGLTDLCRYLIRLLGLTDEKMIETHRNVAVPKGRKIDPSGWSDEDFYLWRSSLFVPREESKTMRVNLPEKVAALVRTGPSRKYDIVDRLYRGDTFIAGDIKKDEDGDMIAGTNKWVHLKQGLLGGRDISNIGFVHASSLIEISE